MGRGGRLWGSQGRAGEGESGSARAALALPGKIQPPWFQISNHPFQFLSLLLPTTEQSLWSASSLKHALLLSAIYCLVSKNSNN